MLSSAPSPQPRTLDAATAGDDAGPSHDDSFAHSNGTNHNPQNSRREKQGVELTLQRDPLPRRIAWKLGTKRAQPQTKMELNRPNVVVLGKKQQLLNGHPAPPQNDDEPDSQRQTEHHLFPPHVTAALLGDWEGARRIGGGLHNMGNTCFLNSVLQCLIYSPPIGKMCLASTHHKYCKRAGFCMFCCFEDLGRQALNANGHAVSPKGIVQNMRVISNVFRRGHQEDAHEFMRYLIQALHTSSLNGIDPKKVQPNILKTTLIHQLFGGELRSQVRCHVCGHCSNTFDPALDLSLNINGSAGTSLLHALKMFVKPDILSGNNQYKCSKCNQKVDASKSFSIHAAPPILVVHLKRFSYTGKIGKFVPYPTHLDLAPYVTGATKSRSLAYDLHGVLVHDGSMNGGHYYCFVKNSNRSWYCMNDSQVRQVKESTVLQQSAYMLFYSTNKMARPAAAQSETPNATTPTQQKQKPTKTASTPPKPNTPNTPTNATPSPTGAPHTPTTASTPSPRLKVLDLSSLSSPALKPAANKVSNGVVEVPPLINREMSTPAGNNNNKSDKSAPRTLARSSSVLSTPSARSMISRRRWSALRHRIGGLWLLTKFSRRSRSETGSRVTPNQQQTNIAPASPTLNGQTESDGAPWPSTPPQTITTQTPASEPMRKQKLETFRPPKSRDADLLFGTKVEKWETVDYSKEVQQNVLLQHPALHPRQRPRSEYDLEYDEGRQRKRKRSRLTVDESGHNVFQEIQNQKAFGGGETSRMSLKKSKLNRRGNDQGFNNES
eukprot:c13308_g1_i1.p1 GENE.c13308_g1_i1~~c13308_g1_i1.p1  ORF type:complete len:777 (+),score=146.55 c13308_g1_i1:130-2460(+)